MELSRINYISIPEGNVKKIEHNDTVIWERNYVYKLKGYSRVVDGQILNCKMPIHVYKDGVEVATIDCGRDLLFNDTLTTDGKIDVGSGKVDLGTLNWNYYQSYSMFTTVNFDTAVAPYGTHNSICSKYATNKINSWNWLDKTIDTGTSFFSLATPTIIIKDTSYDNASDFKTSVNGVMLDYELATHITSPFAPIHLKDNLTFKDDNGYEVEIVEKI